MKRWPAVLFLSVVYLWACGLALSAVELDLDGNGAIDVSRGGTNATTAAGARTNLGAAGTASPTFTGTVTAPVYTTSSSDHWLDVSNASDPSTSGWGSTEAGRIWFNKADGEFKFWTGSAVSSLSVGTSGDTTAPTVSTVTVGTSGTATTVAFSETVTTTGYTSGEMYLSCSTAGTVNLTSPTGSGSSHVFTAASTVNQGDTCTAVYVGTSGHITDASSNPLGTFSGKSVTNNSTQTGGGGGAGTWYYGAPGTDTFSSSVATDAAYCNGGVVSGVTGKSISKLAYKQGTLNAATGAKLAALNTETPGSLLGSGTTSSLTPDAWVEVSITPFTATGNVKVCVALSGNSYVYKNASNDGVWSSVTYASYPPSTLSLSTDTGSAWAVRVYGE